MYETDIGAGVQNFPDGQKCQGLAHTIKERFLGATALSFPGNGSLFNMWQRLAKMNLRLWHTGPRQSPKNHLAKKNSHYDWEIKRKILNTSFKRSFGRTRESPQAPTHPTPQQPSSTGINLAEGKIEDNQKQPTEE